MDIETRNISAQKNVLRNFGGNNVFMRNSSINYNRGADRHRGSRRRAAVNDEVSRRANSVREKGSSSRGRLY